MKKDFLPTNESELLLWLQNFKDQIAIDGVTLKITPDVIALQQAAVQVLIDVINAAREAAQESRKVTGKKVSVKKAGLKSLRTFIKELKVSKNFTNTISKNLGLDKVKPAPDPAGYKPVIVRVIISGGHPQLVYKKAHYKLANVYSQAGSETEMSLVGHTDKSPFNDMRPLKTPGVPEVRRYLIRVVKNNEEQGQSSEIVSIVFAG